MSLSDYPPCDMITDCERERDVVFVVDSSGSIREQNVEGEMDNWQKLKLFLIDVVDRLDIGENKVRWVVRDRLDIRWGEWGIDLI